ncbi:hypothetical protein BV25DRAFT_1941669 [Artomyces pyxidatus]|uniref:Uncharacterized protein n=1 Tax=Artomyces pyxidatus TaxID=48021 RepID=A0ACB8TIF3_9AGAM|nr:hypothetical protein BV25DRAFT_1941669 [Artomyces pyxidatus]
MPPIQEQQHHLAYFQSSPVRGQLEPYDSDTRTGWRYLQCTDTPNELKVLLPPRTAGLYGQLLYLENAELARGRDASWDRILEIRHLKDRMIRKCQRISRFAAPQGGATAAFRIVHAPPDFRLKEMEKWLRAQESGRSTREVPRKESVESVRTGTHSGYSQPPSIRSGQSPRSSRHSQASTTSRTPTAARATTRTQGSSKRRTSVSPRGSTVYTESLSSSGSIRQGRPSTTTAPPRNPYLSPVVEESPIVEEPPVRTATPPPLPNPYGETPSAERHIEDPALRPSAISPEPLPYPYRPPSVHMPASMMQAMGIPPPPEVSQPVMEMPYAETGMPQPTIPDIPQPPLTGDPQGFFGGSELSSAAPSPPSEDAGAGPSRPTLPRRRSSLKQASARAQKVVSWAMDRDWTDHMTKFDHIVYAAEIAGEELEQARKRVHDEISGVKDLRTNIAAALERLRIETERLQLEENVLRDQEHNMTASLERLKEKEYQHKHKVHAVLEETKRVVIAADHKREAELPS